MESKIEKVLGNVIKSKIEKALDDIKNGSTILQSLHDNKAVYITSLGNENEYFFETYDLDGKLIDVECGDKACAAFALINRY